MSFIDWQDPSFPLYIIVDCTDYGGRDLASSSLTSVGDADMGEWTSVATRGTQRLAASNLPKVGSWGKKVNHEAMIR